MDALAFGGTLVLWALRRVMIQRRLWRSGLRAEGEVTDVEETDVRINGRRSWRFGYRYVDHNGRSHTGMSGHLSFRAATAHKVGDRGEVRYDARHPEHSLWAESL